MVNSNSSNAQAAAQPARDEPLLVERLLSLSRLTGTTQDADVFGTNEPLQCPPWARGAYGGQLIAQTLLAAYETVPVDFVVHSIHCHFLTAAKVDLPMTYNVYRPRDSKSFATRLVHAKQRDGIVLLATATFGRCRPHVQNILDHSTPMPRGEQSPGDKLDDIQQSAAGQAGKGQPCDCVRVPVENKGNASERRLRQWVRARRRDPVTGTAIRPSEPPNPATILGVPRGSGNGLLSQHDEKDKMHRAHVAALAYMSDNYFIGTVFRVHNASRFSNLSSPHPYLASAADGEALERYFEALAHEEMDDNRDAPKNNVRVDMMVTLNHTIFFHNPRQLRADEWLLAEMESPWAGDERGVVLQRIWDHRGILVATCMQEGVVRLSQHASKGRL